MREIEFNPFTMTLATPEDIERIYRQLWGTDQEEITMKKNNSHFGYGPEDKQEKRACRRSLINDMLHTTFTRAAMRSQSRIKDAVRGEEFATFGEELNAYKNEVSQ